MVAPAELPIVVIAELAGQDPGVQQVHYVLEFLVNHSGWQNMLIFITNEGAWHSPHTNFSNSLLQNQ